MTDRTLWVPPEDVELLRAIDREGSVAGASRSLGIPRDRAVYRIARLSARLPGGVLVPHRGGAAHGFSRLTEAARRLLEGKGPPRVRAAPAPHHPTLLVGTYRAGREARVDVAGQPVYVDFTASDGERVAVAVDPEAIVVAPGRFVSSARNVWEGTVRSVRARPGESGAARRTVRIRALGRDLAVALTPASLRSLGLSKGRRVFLYVKATALRRAPLYSRMPSVVSE